MIEILIKIYTFIKGKKIIGLFDDQWNFRKVMITISNSIRYYWLVSLIAYTFLIAETLLIMESMQQFINYISMHDNAIRIDPNVLIFILLL